MWTILVILLSVSYGYYEQKIVLQLYLPIQKEFFMPDCSRSFWLGKTSPDQCNSISGNNHD